VCLGLEDLLAKARTRETKSAAVFGGGGAVIGLDTGDGVLI
jgi:hypothetical protein